MVNQQLIADQEEYKKATDFLTQGGKIEAFEILQRLAISGTDCWEVYNDLAAFAIQQGEIETAIEMLTLAIEKEGTPGKARLNLSSIYASQGEGEKALEIISPLLRHSPESLDGFDLVRQILGTHGEPISMVSWARLIADIRAPLIKANTIAEIAKAPLIEKGGNERKRPLRTEAIDEAPVIESDNTGLPVPPPKLRARVHGDRKLESFNSVGQTVLSNIEAALKMTSLSPDANLRVLDFGCGSGRIARWLHGAHKSWIYEGTDIDAEAIGWCQKNLSSIGKFGANLEWPPLTYADQSFDFVYSISIFTHLPEDMQIAWLGELQRVTRKGGFLVLTVHGEGLFKKLFSAEEKALADFDAKGFSYVVGSETEGLPDFYRTTFHSPKYIHNVWGRYFKIERIIEKGIANNQDLVLCQRIN